MKKSHCLILIGAAVVLSATSVIFFLWIAGVMLSTIIIFSALALLFLLRKISSLRHRTTSLTSQASHFRQRSVGIVRDKIIKKMNSGTEKISA
jgi:hypothetical protein